MYDKLIEELRQHHCDAKEDDTQEVCEKCAYDVIIADKSVPSGIASVCVCGLMHRAADAIEGLSMKLHGDEAAIAGMKREIERMVVSGNKPRWIPVTERLPEEGENILVANKRGKHYDIDKGWWNGTFFNRCSKGGYHNVTHWMPLPEPPKEE